MKYSVKIVTPLAPSTRYKTMPSNMKINNLI